MRQQLDICSVDECRKPVRSTGLCNAHHLRKLRHGSPLGGRRSVWVWIENVALGIASDDCIIWPFSRTQDGYGRLRVGDRKAEAHREICTRAHGAPPSDRHEAAHLCGNGHLGCVNPRHLEWQTHAENSADRAPENRAGWKLQPDQVRAIRRALADTPQSVIAERYGISTKTVRQIRDRKTWAHL